MAGAWSRPCWVSGALSWHASNEHAQAHEPGRRLHQHAAPDQAACARVQALLGDGRAELACKPMSMLKLVPEAGACTTKQFQLAQWHVHAGRLCWTSGGLSWHASR